MKPEFLQEPAEEAELPFNTKLRALLPLRPPVQCLCDYERTQTAHPIKAFASNER